MATIGPYAIPPNGLDSSFFDNAEVPRLQVADIRTLDVARRHEIYNTIQHIIVRDVPIYTFLWVPMIDAYDTRIHGIKRSPLAIDFWNITDWTT
jgi:ABC-type transport system substrate-binding protein